LNYDDDDDDDDDDYYYYYYYYGLLDPGVCPPLNTALLLCAYAANMADKDLDIFAVGAVSLHHIL
jgi:hypothetical protein